MVDEFTRTQVLDQGNRHEQPCIGHQAVVVEGDWDAGRGGCVVASIGCSFSGAGSLFPKPISQIQKSAIWLLQGLSARPSLGGFEVRKPDEYPHRSRGFPVEWRPTHFRATSPSRTHRIEAGGRIWARADLILSLIRASNARRPSAVPQDRGSSGRRRTRQESWNSSRPVIGSN